MKETRPGRALIKIVAAILALAATPRLSAESLRVRVETGWLEGTTSSDSGLRIFRGIPYAAPPVGDLRWREPAPVKSWDGVRDASHYATRAVQSPPDEGQPWRDAAMGEDCLYLNIWTPAKSPDEHLPVMVWIHGGGFTSGSGSDQEGDHVARRGVVVVGINYRLGVFGFLAHPALTAESPHHASGNYGLLDQLSALKWVHRNIAAFGGDPGNVTIFGESAGSMSVCALMASPLARGLFHRAIGESGAFFPVPGRDRFGFSSTTREKEGEHFAEKLGATSLAELRAMPAEAIYRASTREEAPRFWPQVDGYFLPQAPIDTFKQGEQARVPLLAGWNADELRVYNTFGNQRPTREKFIEDVKGKWGDAAENLLRVYRAGTDEAAVRSAGDLVDDLVIGYGTWKWLELQATMGHVPVYRFLFEKDSPIAPGTVINGVEATRTDVGARHASEMNYVFGTLDAADLDWTDDDRKVSDVMIGYWTNFAKTGDPNGPGLPEWPRYEEAERRPVMHLNVDSHAAREAHRERYLFLDTDELKPAAGGGSS